MAISGKLRSVCTNQSIMMSPSPLPAPLFRGSLDPVRARMAITEFRQSLWPHELQALHGVVAMDFLDIELAHEIDGFLRDDLARHHEREARRIGNDEARGDEIGPALQPAIDLRIRKADILASLRVISGEEASANIAFIGLCAGIAAERCVEMREVRQVGHVGHQTLDPRFKGLSRIHPALLQATVAVTADSSPHPPQLRTLPPVLSTLYLPLHQL